MGYTKNKIAIQFSRSAKSYDQEAQLQREMSQALLAQLDTSQPSQIIDMGCGTGWLLNQLANFPHLRLTGVDLAPGMIAVAEQQVPSATLICGDMTRSGLEKKSADVVISNAAVQWCDLKGVAQEFSRICKPDGQLLCSTFGPQTYRELQAAWRLADPNHPRVHGFSSPQQFRVHLEQYGFTQFDIRTEICHIAFASANQLLKHVRLLGSTNADDARPRGLTSPSRMARFKQALEEQTDQRGNLKLTYECCYLSCRRRAI